MRRHRAERGRGLAISPEQRDRILACTDLAQLEVWLRKAIVAGAAGELFETSGSDA